MNSQRAQVSQSFERLLYPIYVPRGRSKTRYRVGYINHKAQIELPPEFDDGTHFSEGLAAVSVSGKWGAIDLSGRSVFPPTLAARFLFKGGLAKLHAKSGYGVIDSHGTFVVPPQYDLMGDFSEGMAWIMPDEDVRELRCGYIDNQGITAIPHRFYAANNFSEGLAAVCLGGLWGYITPTGDFQISPQFLGPRRSASGKTLGMVPGEFVGGLAPVSTGSDCSFINKKGQVVFAGEYELASSFAEGRALVMQSGKAGFVDMNGIEVVKPQFAYGEDYSEGLAVVAFGTGKDQKIGYVDKEGNAAIAPKFLSAHTFRQGLAFVETEDSIGYIDHSGEFVWRGAFVEYPRLRV